MTLLTALIALPLLAGPATPGGLDRTQIDASAKWVAHLDIESFHSSQLYQEIKAADPDGQIDLGLAQIASEHGIQLLDDVYSITAYGTVLGEEHGVVIVRANAHLDQALAKVQEQAGAKPVRVGERECLQWGSGEDGALSCLRPATGERRELVLARSQDDLVQALDVLDKKRPALDSQPQSDLFAPPAAGTFVFVAASGILEELAGAHGHDVQQFSAMTRLAKGLRLEIGELGGSIAVDLRLRTEKPEDARRVQKIFDGLLALPGLMQDESEQSELIDRLTQAIHVEALNETAHLRFQYGTHALFTELQALEALDGGTGPLKALHQGVKSAHKHGGKPKEVPK